MPVYLTYASNLSTQAIRLPISTYKFANIYAHTRTHIYIIPVTFLLVLEGGPTKKNISVIYVYI